MSVSILLLWFLIKVIIKLSIINKSRFRTLFREQFNDQLFMSFSKETNQEIHSYNSN